MREMQKQHESFTSQAKDTHRNCLKYVQSQFGALPAAAEQLFTKPRRGPKSNRTSRLFPCSF